MKSIFLTFLITLSISCFSQDYWKTYKVNDGLSTNRINGVAVYNNTVFLASDSGLSVLENEVITNYNFDSLGIRRIDAIRNYKDTVWLVSDSGLVRFYNGNAKLFKENEGLISNEIRDIEINSKGHVYVGAAAGLVVIKPDTIIHDSSTIIFDIGINENDLVVASINHFVIFLGGGFPVPTIAYLDSGNWVEILDTSQNFILIDPKFRTLSNGKLGLATSNRGMFEVDSGFILRNIALDRRNFPTRRSQLFDVGTDSSVWTIYNDLALFSKENLIKYKNNIQLNFFNELPSEIINDIRIVNGTVFLATDNGLAMASDEIDPFINEYNIQTSSISTSITNTDFLFTEMDTSLFGTHNSVFDYKNANGFSWITKSSLWLSAKKGNNEVVSYNAFQDSDFVPGPISRNNMLTKPNIYKITKAEIDFHLGNRNKPGYKMSEVIENWPAKGLLEAGEFEDLAPFVDANNDNCYDPQQGDFPYIIGDTMIYLMYNDGGAVVPFFKSKSLGIEVHAMISVFNQPNIKHIDESIFVRYIIVNRSEEDYKDFKIGVTNNFSVGFSRDDFVGCDPQSGIVYKYNSSANSSNQYPNNSIPSVGLKIINDTLDKFIAFNGQSNQSLNYIDSTDYFRAMDGLWNDSSMISYGGNGYNPSANQFSNHLFPGDINLPSEWSQINSGQANGGQEYFSDLLSIVPAVNLKSGERKVLDLVFGVAQDTSSSNYLENVTLLINQLNLAADFQKGYLSILPDPSYSNCLTGIENFENYAIKKPQLSLFPNPTSGDINVLAKENLERIEIYNAQGQLVASLIGEQAMAQKISLPTNLPSGIYVVQALGISGLIYSEKLMFNKN